MGIDFQIMSSNREKLSVFGDPDDTLPRINTVLGEYSLLNSIHEYADTMFNRKQIRRRIAEIDIILESDAESTTFLQEIRQGAAAALENGGYLWCSGD